MITSLYAVETELPGMQRPADDVFWSALPWVDGSGSAGTLEESYIEGATRYHRLSRGNLDIVRARLTPRARLAIWPALSPDLGAVLGPLPRDGLVEGVWQDTDGWLHSSAADYARS